jgi:hypothetical protein
MMKKLALILIILPASLLVSSCATNIEVSGSFPAPLSQQLPLGALVIFDQAFSTYRFENTDGKEVSIGVGQIQVDLFTAVTKSMFRKTVYADSMPTKVNMDMVLVPRVEEVQISMPFETKLNVFEVWIKYHLQLFDRNGDPVADWIMPAYGKTPTKFLKSDSEALNQAAIVALRDAGAHFIIGFSRVPEIRQWLDRAPTRPAKQKAAAL